MKDMMCLLGLVWMKSWCHPSLSCNLEDPFIYAKTQYSDPPSLLRSPKRKPVNVYRNSWRSAHPDQPSVSSRINQ